MGNVASVAANKLNQSNPIKSRFVVMQCLHCKQPPAELQLRIRKKRSILTPQREYLLSYRTNSINFGSLYKVNDGAIYGAWQQC